MQKEEFPTFLNEQPSVVFGRTTRELMVFLIGLSFAFVIWSNLDFLGSGLGSIILKLLFAVIPVIGSIFVAFIKVGSRPLEEWAIVGFFYAFTPKVFIYLPSSNEDEADEATQSPDRDTIAVIEMDAEDY